MEIEYKASVPVQLTHEKVLLFSYWFSENKIKSYFAFGRYYFSNAEDALAFRLKFGDMLNDA